MGEEVVRLWAFSRLDCRAAEQYLEKQAAKGYILKNIAQPYLLWATFEKTAPKKIRYCIDSLNGDKAERQAYIEFAADGGWHAVCILSGQIVFASEEGENPPPMQTDWQEEYRQIRKSLWKPDIPMGIFVIILFWLMYKLMGFLDIDVTVGEIMTAGHFMGFGLAVFAISCMAVFLRAVLFYIRSEIAIRKGVPLKPAKSETGRFWAIMHIFYGIALLWISIACIFHAISGQLELRDGFSYLIIGVLVVMALLIFAKERIGAVRSQKIIIVTGIIGIVLAVVQCGTNL